MRAVHCLFSSARPRHTRTRNHRWHSNRLFRGRSYRTKYEYDDAGVRVAETKTVDGNGDGDFVDPEDTSQRTDYLVDHRNPTGYAQIFEEWLNGEFAKSYTLGLDVISQWAAAIASGSPLLLLYDGHGSTRGLVDATGQPLSGQIYRYDAYGNPIGFDSTTAATSLLYTGEKTDLTGLQYLRARYYNPATGTFNRLDPFFGNLSDPLSLHKYLYVHADAVNGIDPSGAFLGSLICLGLATVIGVTADVKYNGAVVTGATAVMGKFLWGALWFYGLQMSLAMLEGLAGQLLVPDPEFRLANTASEAQYAAAIKSTLMETVNEHDNHGGTAAEHALGAAAAEQIANAYARYVFQTVKNDGFSASSATAWFANIFGGTKCKNWAAGLSTELVLPAVLGSGWKVKTHYNSAPWGRDYMLFPYKDEGQWHLVPVFGHHSFVSLTYHQRTLSGGKVSRPNWVLDPWGTRRPDVYDARDFHSVWRLNQWDPLTNMDNSNIDIDEPSW